VTHTAVARSTPRDPAARFGQWLAQPVDESRRSTRRYVPRKIADAFVRRHLATMPCVSAEGEADRIELFLRVGPRDLEVAPLAVASLRARLRNPIAALTIVTPAPGIPALRQSFPDAEFLTDEEVLGIDRLTAIRASAPAGRESWVAQQFITMCYVSERATRPCLVWDADLLLLRPLTVRRRGVATLAISLEHHYPYFHVIEALLPGLPLPAWSSTVAHHMVMEPELMRELLAEVQRRAPHAQWWQTVLAQIDPRETSCFADYELYGQWLRTRHTSRIALSPFRDVSMSRAECSPEVVDGLMRSGHVDFLGLHWWIE
jgi:hypothetical protein